MSKVKCQTPLTKLLHLLLQIKGLNGINLYNNIIYI